MRRSKLFIVFFVLLVGLFQVHCQGLDDDETYEDGGVESGGGSDDEDNDNEGSGSGYMDSPTESYFDEPEVATTTTIKKKGPKIRIQEVDVDATQDTDLEVDTNDDDDTQSSVSILGAGSFFGSTQFMAALIVGGCVGLLFAICVVMLLAYRMRKKDEGSYALDEQKKPSSPSYQYTQGQEYYA